MKTPPTLALGLAVVLAQPALAGIVHFDISPPGSTAAEGLSPDNEVPPVVGSDGSGGEILEGIRLDTETGLLKYAIGYGVDAGFGNLTGIVTAAHIHGPAAIDGTNGPIHDFVAAGHHLAATPPTDGGVILGSVILTAEQVADLRAGLYYVNLHTDANPDGEIRGQLIELTNVAPEIECPPEPIVLECTSQDGTPATLTADVFDADGDELLVVWTIDDVEVASETVPSGGDTTEATVTLDTLLGMGEHTVLVAVSDGEADPVSCEYTVTVEDTTPPEITRVTTTPSRLWPPNHKMRSVKVRVWAEDICSEVTNRIVSVESNEPENGLGDGNTEPDWEITGDLTVDLRAERAGPGEGRVYTITVESVDASGNAATATTTVEVPHDMRGGRGGRLGR